MDKRRQSLEFAYMDVRILVGINLRRSRYERELSQEELAYAAGIAPSFLSQLENGKRSATVTTLDILAKALRIPITDLFMPVKTRPGGIPPGKRRRSVI